MKSERLQILLEPEQRARLDRESKSTGKPIGALIREAIDARYGDRKRRRAAVAEMRSVTGRQREPDPAELERLIRAEHGD